MLPKTFTGLLVPILLVKVDVWLVGASSFAFLKDVLAGLETVIFVGLDTAVCGLKRPVKPSAGCCVPVLQGF